MGSALVGGWGSAGGSCLHLVAMVHDFGGRGRWLERSSSLIC